ncbi:MAG: hypothetical protein AAGA25_12145 [Planctomycetota bacterium]
MPKPKPNPNADTPEHRRLREDRARQKNWKQWGPYLSERQWATVREDYSADGNVWDYFPHDHARSRAYRWGEDGLLGFTDRECRLCFALALWNENDVILKERLFGLTGHQGNHGEDVKESYYYLDSTPTHSYAKAMYRYPQSKYPYDELVEESAKRTKKDLEYELEDTGAFDENRFFEVQAEYAKADVDDLLIKIAVTNRGPDAAPLHVLPQLWFRNTWVWGCEHEGCHMRPDMRMVPRPGKAMSVRKVQAVKTEHETLGNYTWVAGPNPDTGELPDMLFTENHTNHERLFGEKNRTRFHKDAFHRHIVDGEKGAVNPQHYGTKAAAHYQLDLAPGESKTLTLRLFPSETPRHTSLDQELSPEAFDVVFDARVRDAEQFYDIVIPKTLTDEQRLVSRQAYAGLLWTKQFYHYIIDAWLNGDPDMRTPPEHRQKGRNHDWPHLFARDILSMPDKWEYPWFAAWDTAFHMLPFCRIDADFAKRQLDKFLREWYMHPNGQIPAYEFAFGDVNPPVHAWAVWRIYKMTAPRGQRDRAFLASCFQKLLLNFTW